MDFVLHFSSGLNFVNWRAIIWRLAHPCYWNGWRSREKLGLRGGVLWQEQCMQDQGWSDTLKPREDLCLAHCLAHTVGQGKRTWEAFGSNWCQEATWSLGLSVGGTSPISSTGTEMEGRRLGDSCWIILLKTCHIAVRSAHPSCNLMIPLSQICLSPKKGDFHFVLPWESIRAD